MRESLSIQSVTELKIREAKVLALQASRLAAWLARPDQYRRAPMHSNRGLVLQHRILVDACGVQSHPRLEAGKMQNLQIAAAHLDSRRIDALHGFSFWRLLGRPTRARGFALGTELRDGCVVPSYGGGLCLLSGALFRLAAELDWQISERHGHTRSAHAASQVDATVMWPQVDLRFAPRVGAAVLRVRLRAGVLSVAAYGTRRATSVKVWREPIGPVHPRAHEALVHSRVLRERSGQAAEVLGVDAQRVSSAGLARNCLTCNQVSCAARPRILRVLP